MGINFLVFIVTSFSDSAFVFLGLQPAAFLNRPWTLLTNIFVHAGFWHILGNMITLFFFGRFFARLVGDGRFLLVYFGGGILGSIFFLILGPSYSIAVGASGAIFALAGALVVMMPNMKVLVYFIVPMPLWLVVLLFFIIWPFIFGLSLNIAWQAHLGGLIAGLIAGYFFKKNMRYYYVR